MISPLQSYPYTLLLKHSCCDIHSDFLAGFNLNELRDVNVDMFTQGWKEVLELITSKKVHPRVDSVWQFENAVDAFKQLSERKNIGKVVIKP